MSSIVNTEDDFIRQAFSDGVKIGDRVLIMRHE
jgi:hypothetical protein